MKQVEFNNAKLMELNYAESQQVSGGWVLAILGTAGLVVSGVWAIGFVAGAAYAAGEHIYNKVND